MSTAVQKPRPRGMAKFRSRWKNMPKQVRWAGMVALVVVLYLLPIRGFYLFLGIPLGGDLYLPLYTASTDMAQVLFDTAVFVLLAIGLNVVVGFAGLLDLGYFGFFAVGAYTVALVTSPESRLDVTWPWLLAVPAAVAVTMLFGVILGVPTLRLRGDYLAIVTLGFAEMIRLYAGLNDGLLQGQRGIPSIPSPPGEFNGKPLFGVADSKPYYWLALTVIIVVIFLVRNLTRSRVGRAWVAIREDEDAAQVMGVPTFVFKLWAFAIGAAVAGLTGALYAGNRGFVNSDSFILENSILVLAAVILGGAGNITGAVVGGAVTWYLPEWLRGVGRELGLGDFDPAEYRIAVFGLVLIVMMIFRPQGIIANKRRAAEFADRRKEAVVGE